MPGQETGAWDWWKKKINDKNKEKDEKRDQPRAPEPSNSDPDTDPDKPQAPTTVPAGDYGWGKNDEEDPDKTVINIKDLPPQEDGEEDEKKDK